MIEGISLGNDDYPVEPFLPLELVARVGAIFRRIEMARGGNSGIGLSLALASAEHMNGTIRARNKLPPESGAIFELIITLLHQASR